MVFRITKLTFVTTAHKNRKW